MTAKVKITIWLIMICPLTVVYAHPQYWPEPSNPKPANQLDSSTNLLKQIKKGFDTINDQMNDAVNKSNLKLCGNPDQVANCSITLGNFTSLLGSHKRGSLNKINNIKMNYHIKLLTAIRNNLIEVRRNLHDVPKLLPSSHRTVVNDTIARLDKFLVNFKDDTLPQITYKAKTLPCKIPLNIDIYCNISLTILKSLLRLMLAHC